MLTFACKFLEKIIGPPSTEEPHKKEKSQRSNDGLMAGGYEVLLRFVRMNLFIAGIIVFGGVTWKLAGYILNDSSGSPSTFVMIFTAPIGVLAVLILLFLTPAGWLFLYINRKLESIEKRRLDQMDPALWSRIESKMRATYCEDEEDDSLTEKELEYRQQQDFAELDDLRQQAENLVKAYLRRKNPAQQLMKGVGQLIYMAFFSSILLLLINYTPIGLKVPFLRIDQLQPIHVACWYGGVSLVAFLQIWRDKSLATKGGRPRIPERTLHFWEFLGGFGGSLAAQLVFRHKVRKIAYQAILSMTMLIHAGLWYWLIQSNFAIVIELGKSWDQLK